MTKKVLTAVVCLGLAIVPTVHGWRLVASYPTPGSEPRGYSVQGIESGWVVQAERVPYVYQVYWYTGSIISSFRAPGGSGAWGITGSPISGFYVSNNRNSWIYKVTSTGSVTSSFQCPVPGPAGIDLPSYPHYLHITIPNRNVVAVVDRATGSLVSSFRGPGSEPTACCVYATTFIGDAGTHTVYENGAPIITGLGTPAGMDEEATTDVIALFVVDDATDRIYFYSSGSAVAPASLGRVKALFR